MATPWSETGGAQGIQSTDHEIANQEHREIEEIKANSPMEFSADEGGTAAAGRSVRWISMAARTARVWRRCGAQAREA